MDDITSSLLVLRGERVVHEFHRRSSPSSLFYTFSVSKPIIALTTHLLAERGALHLDDPVARHWPGYAQHGKGEVTIRQVLTHRAGVPISTRSTMGDVRIAHDWDASVHAAQTARLRYRPGRRVWYHTLSFGFILGELIQRVTGLPLTEVVQSEIFEPLGMRDSYLQLPQHRQSDAVPLTSIGPLERYRRSLFNDPVLRRALVPAASLSTTAADLAAFYRMLLRGGSDRSGQQIVRPATITEMMRVSSDGEFDRGMLHTARWGTGVQLGFPGKIRVHGTHARADTFGHNGSNICNAWADPHRDLVFVYLSNLAMKRLRARVILTALSDRAFSRFGSG